MGGYSYHFDVRQTYVRVYDPRGFEFEITIPNLLWILENNNSIKGKGLEGKFVYGWSGTKLLLVPIDSPDYRDIVEKTKLKQSTEFLNSKDLIVGYTYQTFNEEYVYYIYMGRFNKYKKETISTYWLKKDEKEKILDDSWHKNIFNQFEMERFVVQGKYYWFAQFDCNSQQYTIRSYSNISKKFVYCSNNQLHEKYNKLEQLMKSNIEFNPIDYDNYKIKPLPFEAFKTIFNDNLCNNCFASVPVYAYKNNSFVKIEIKHNYKIPSFTDEYQICDYTNNKTIYFNIINDTNLKEIYDYIKPYYCERYLTNGYLYERIGYYGTKK